MLVKLTKAENARLRWLRKAMSTDVCRPTLTGFNTAGDHTVATDGYRAHFIRTPDDLEKGPFKFKENLKATDTVATVEPIKGTFPEVHQVLPDGEPVCEIFVSARLLREALEGMGGGTGMVRLAVSEGERGKIEVFGLAKDKTEAYALIMPMAPRDRQSLTWKPSGD